MNHKDELLQWTIGLEAYAKEQGVPMRILDTIEECREHIQSEDMEWQEIRTMLEQVLESVCLKTGQDKVAVQNQGKSKIPVEKVKSQIKNMAEQCHKENLSSVTAIENRKNLNIKECVRKMDEISHTEAHLDKMLDGNLYLDFFQNLKNIYERDAEKTAVELINDIGGNYSHMTERMKSMFQDIGGYADGIGNEKFYREYESEKAALGNKLIGEARTEDFGSGAILEFAQNTKGEIQKIVRTLQPKKYFLSFLPILLLVVIFFGTAIVGYQNADVSETAISEEEGNGLIDKVGDELEGKAAEKVTEAGFLVAFGYFAFGMIASLGSVLIFLVLLLIVLYVFYLRRLKAWYNRQICRNCGEYLHIELGRFGQEKIMHEKAGKAIEHIVEEYERQYIDILNRMFLGTKYENGKVEHESELESLQREWEKLKYC